MKIVKKLKLEQLGIGERIVLEEFWFSVEF